jgi:hypothetical protein
MDTDGLSSGEEKEDAVLHNTAHQDINTTYSHTNLPFKAGPYKRRMQQCTMRCVRYDIKKDPNNYYREHLMLFTSWRSEDHDIDGGDVPFETRYNEALQIMLPYIKHYDKLKVDWDDLHLTGEKYAPQLDTEEVQQAQDNAPKADIGLDLGMRVTERKRACKQPDMVTYEEYKAMIGTLSHE